MPTNRASMQNKPSNRNTALARYIKVNNIVVPPTGRLNKLTARFSSFANTVQTRMNSSNGTGGALGGTLEAQVDRALSQALRQPGGGSTAVQTRPGDSSIATMVGGSGGSQPAMSPYQATMLREGRIVQADILSMLDNVQPLSPFTDPGDVASLQSLVRGEVNALLEEFSYTRLVPRQQRVRVLLGGLLGFNYDHYGLSSPFNANPPNGGDVLALVNLLNLGGPLIPTISVEDQLASQQILGTDGALFDTQWNNFWSNAIQTVSGVPWPLWEWVPGTSLQLPSVPGGLGSLGPKPIAVDTQTLAVGPRSPQLTNQAPWQLNVVQQTNPVPGLSYAERMIQADLLLPVIAQDASRVADSLTAIGFTVGEQEATFATFWSFVDADLLPAATPAGIPTAPAVVAPVFNAGNPLGIAGGSGIPTPIPAYMTVADIVDWTQNLTGPTSADLLRNAGALGLNLLCDQADELFWLALAMLDPTILVATPGPGDAPGTGPISALGDTEVQLEVASLATDLNTFAKLAY
jgi:hypothetical protein